MSDESATNITFTVPGAFCSLNGENIGQMLDNFVSLSNTVQAFFGTLTDRLPSAPGPNPVLGYVNPPAGVASQFAAEVAAAAEPAPAPRPRGRRPKAEKEAAAAVVNASPSVQRAMAEQAAATAAVSGGGGNVHPITRALAAVNAEEARQAAGSPREPQPSVGATKQNVIAALDDYARTFGQPAAKAYIGAWLQNPGALLKDVSPDLYDALVDQINQDISEAAAATEAY